MKQVKHVNLQISGMYCSSCEKTITKALQKLRGVEKAVTSYEKSAVEVTYDSNLVMLENITAAIQAAGYTVQSAPKKFNALQILGIVSIIAAMYFLIQHTTGFNYIPEVDQSMGYGIIFAVGVLTSLHCIAMCGGINLSQCIREKPEQDGTLNLLIPGILYNLGRVFSYTMIGGLAGALGSVLTFSDRGKGTVAIIAGVFMLGMGLKMLNIPGFQRFRIPLPKFTNRVQEKATHFGPFYVGLLNGLMPCGPLQTMQIYALGTGSFTAGALAMFFFSLGTVPLMFGLGAASSLLSQRFTRKMLQASAILVIVLGLVMMNRGFSLTGTDLLGKLPTRTTPTAQAGTATVNGKVQYVTTALEPYRYAPIVVKKGVPVRWTIQVEKSKLNGCNRAFIIPEYGIRKMLVPGENFVEFTPKEEGKITYTCWMGMITSNIQVVKDF